MIFWLLIWFLYWTYDVDFIFELNKAYLAEEEIKSKEIAIIIVTIVVVMSQESPKPRLAKGTM